MKNIFRKIHLWLSVPFGLVITITCFTGALIVFEEDITRFYYRDIASVSPQGEPLPLAQLLQVVEESLPGSEVSGVTILSSSGEAYKVNISSPQRATYYVNQYTGVVNGKYERLEFFRTTLRLHRWLLDKNPGNGKIFWGKMIVGASTISFVVILLTGLVIWYPKNRKMLRNRLKIVLTKGRNRFWYDLHVAGGFYVLLLLLAMALTGLTWSYRWYSDALYGVFGANGANGGNKKTAVSAVSGATPVAAEWKVDSEEIYKYTPWQAAVDAVTSEHPVYGRIQLSKETISVYADAWGNQRACDRYEFDSMTGELKSVQKYDDNSKRSKMRGWVYSVHVGSWGGIFSRLLAFFAAILGATLPLTGYYFWIKRIRKRK